MKGEWFDSIHRRARQHLVHLLCFMPTSAKGMLRVSQYGSQFQPLLFVQVADPQKGSQLHVGRLQWRTTFSRSIDSREAYIYIYTGGACMQLCRCQYVYTSIDPHMFLFVQSSKDRKRESNRANLSICWHSLKDRFVVLSNLMSFCCSAQ